MFIQSAHIIGFSRVRVLKLVQSEDSTRLALIVTRPTLTPYGAKFLLKAIFASYTYQAHIFVFNNKKSWKIVNLVPYGGRGWDSDRPCGHTI